jgi:hypothetical protein
MVCGKPFLNHIFNRIPNHSVLSNAYNNLVVDFDCMQLLSEKGVTQMLTTQFE